MNKIKEQLEQASYDYAIAIATEAERKAQAACGPCLSFLMFLPVWAVWGPCLPGRVFGL